MSRLYLDVDGVLLTVRRKRAAPGVAEFVAEATRLFDCFWLTTHCRRLDDLPWIRYYLGQFLPADIVSALEKSVRPAAWTTLKTEALDWNSDFFWLDDAAMEAEKAELAAHGCLDRLVPVDLNREGELKRVLDVVCAAQGLRRARTAL